MSEPYFGWRTSAPGAARTVGAADETTVSEIEVIGRRPGAAQTTGFWSRDPGFIESLIPVWGSTRGLIADLKQGDRRGAAINGAMLLSELNPLAWGATALSKAGIRAAMKAGTSRTWNATRKRMARQGYFKEGETGHHWFFPQASTAPLWIVNHPANIVKLPADVHKRIHSRDLKNGLPRFNMAERLYYGTPSWLKVEAGRASGLTVGKASMAGNQAEPVYLGDAIDAPEARQEVSTASHLVPLGGGAFAIRPGRINDYDSGGYW